MIGDLTLDPTIFRTGPLGITWPGLGYALALVVIVRAFCRHADAARIPPAIAGRVGAGALLAGIGGAVLGRFLAHPAHFLATPADLPRFWEGGSDPHWVGAAMLLGAGLAVRPHGPAFGAAIARATPSILLGLASVATGSFLGGATWGGATSGTWGIVYWHPFALLPPELIGVPLHPAPLYRALGALLVAALLALSRRRGHSDERWLWSLGTGGYALLVVALAFCRIASDGWLAATGGLALATIGAGFLRASSDHGTVAAMPRRAPPVRSGGAFATALAMAIGLGLQATPLPESPGRWVHDPAQAAAAEGAWIVDYAIASPRVGDRISTGLYLALAEGEQRWAAAYLRRQDEALSRVAPVCTPPETARLLRHYRALVGKTDAPEQSLRLLFADSTGPGLRTSAARELASTTRGDRDDRAWENREHATGRWCWSPRIDGIRAPQGEEARDT